MEEIYGASKENWSLIEMNTELQVQYTSYKNGLQQIAQKIGDVEQEAEEHKSVNSLYNTSYLLAAA
jgi:hypothetical protein